SSLLRKPQTKPPDNVAARARLTARAEKIRLIDARARKQSAQNRPLMLVVCTVVEIGPLRPQAPAVFAKPAARGAKHCKVDVTSETDVQLLRQAFVRCRDNHRADALACGDATFGPAPDPVCAALLVIRRAGNVNHVVAPQCEFDGIWIGD